MFSVSRFLFKTGRTGLKQSTIANLLKNNQNLFKLQLFSFGAKVKDGAKSDKEVDKSKKSVSGGSTTSDSERKETTTHTMKISKPSATTGAKQDTPTTQASKPVSQPSQGGSGSQSSNGGSQPSQGGDNSSSGSQVKRIDTVPGHKVLPNI
jgi:hypothetical protein